MKVTTAETRVMVMLYDREKVNLNPDWESRLNQIRDVGIRIYGASAEAQTSPEPADFGSTVAEESPRSSEAANNAQAAVRKSDK